MARRSGSIDRVVIVKGHVDMSAVRCIFSFETWDDWMNWTTIWIGHIVDCVNLRYIDEYSTAPRSNEGLVARETWSNETEILQSSFNDERV